MFKVIVVAVVVTIVGLFVMSKIDPNINTGNSNNNYTSDTTSKNTVKVTITGNILHPGEYLISPNSTLGDLIIKAGGTLVNADPNAYTATLIIGNRTNFYIASKSEIPDTCVVTDIEKVNINTATKEQLATINGLSNAQIEAILNYRNNNGMFYCLEDVMNVSGIGEKTYLSIRDKIIVAWLLLFVLSLY